MDSGREGYILGRSHLVVKKGVYSGREGGRGIFGEGRT